ncbi:hypothetical protein VZG28_04840 [Synechococcus elongatus IITB4]|uniref:hypothetical protein n=1 Tax=Synechococcus elongatus TaxID=32046 RepID=UPI0030CA6755
MVESTYVVTGGIAARYRPFSFDKVPCFVSLKLYQHEVDLLVSYWALVDNSQCSCELTITPKHDPVFNYPNEDGNGYQKYKWYEDSNGFDHYEIFVDRLGHLCAKFYYECGSDYLIARFGLVSDIKAATVEKAALA